MRISLALVLCLFAIIPSQLSAETGKRAWIVISMKQYKQATKIMKESDPFIIVKDDAKDLHYRNFEGGDIVKAKASEFYDLLYEDVSQGYLEGLELLANEKYQEALDKFKKAGNEKTIKGKKKFSSTHTYKYYLDEKLLQCYLNLGNFTETDKLFSKIFKSGQYHSTFRLKRIYMDYVIGRNLKKNAGQAVTFAGELLKKTIRNKEKKFKLELAKALLTSLDGNSRIARNEMVRLGEAYKGDIKNLENILLEARATMLIYHQKKYRDGEKLYRNLMEKNRKAATAETYLKLAYCYENMDEPEQARWYYLKAFVGQHEEAEEKAILAKIEAINKKIRHNEGNKNLNEFAKNLKTTYEKKKK